MKKLLILWLFIFSLAASVHASALDDGLTAYYQKNWAAAAPYFKKAMNENPKNSLALVYSIVTSFWIGTSERDIQAAEDRLTDAPNDQLNEVRLGFMYYTKALVRGARPDQASATFREASRMGPSALIHTGLGIAYFDIGNFLRARKELARAMDMNPSDVLPYEYMGRILLSIEENPESAANYFKQEINLMPTYPDGHYYYASALDAEGQSDSAIAEYQRTAELDPLGIGRGVDAKVSLGDLYLKNKQYQDARKAFQEALKMTPNDQSLKQRLAQVDKEEKSKKQ